MPSKNPQGTTPEQLMKIMNSMQEVFKENASKQELLELGEALVDMVKEVQKHVSVKVRANESVMKMECERLGKEVADFEKRMRKYADKKGEEVSKQLTTKLNELSALVGYLEEKLEQMPSEYDDSEMRDMMHQMHEAMEDMPKEFDATELTTTLAELKKEIDELKERPIGKGGGGVTNMRIIQAFKYILKTEAPVGDIDGVNTTYTVSQPIFAVLSFSLNGETIAQLPNYTISNKTITFSTALPAVYSGKDFECKYI